MAIAARGSGAGRAEGRQSDAVHAGADVRKADREGEAEGRHDAGLVPPGQKVDGSGRAAIIPVGVSRSGLVL